MSKDRLLIILALLAGISALVVMVGFIGQGNVRHTQIFWTEKVEQTVVFEDVDDQVHLRAISGVGGEPNPTLISRTGFVYILTVINNGDKHHRLYIDGFNVQTDLLEPGKNETITLLPDKEGVFNYYDKREHLNHLGQIKIVSVVPSDDFEGIWRDLI